MKLFSFACGEFGQGQALPLPLRKQLIDFINRRQGSSRPDCAALQPGYGVGKPQRLFNGKTCQKSIDESAVKGVACARRIFAVNMESWRVYVLTLKISKHTLDPKRRRREMRACHLMHLL